MKADAYPYIFTAICCTNSAGYDPIILANLSIPSFAATASTAHCLNNDPRDEFAQSYSVVSELGGRLCISRSLIALLRALTSAR